MAALLTELTCHCCIAFFCVQREDLFVRGGVKQDVAEAKKWYQKAAANGNVNAAQSLKLLP